MIDIFLQKDVKKLLKNKKIVLMGDSNMRALYKDILCLLNNNKLILQSILKTKGETSCFGDQLLSGGLKYNGRDYREERKGCCGNTILSFYFLTRVYDNYVKKTVANLSKNPRNMPDILFVNSCLWDVTRWGPNGVKPYKKNLVLLMQDLKKQMPDCLVIWVTAPPIACDPSGGFLVKEIAFLKYSIRFHVVEANHYARKVVVEHGFDVVDSHYHLKLQIHRRTPDGIHWYPEAVRYVTNLLLTHISIAWNVSLPHRFKSDRVEENPISIFSEDEDTNNLNKVSSVIVKPNDLEKCTNDKQKESKKNKAETCTTPQRFKKKKTPLREKNENFQESHHSYMKRLEGKKRRNRIRQWKKPVENLPCKTKSVEPRNFSKNCFVFRGHCSSYCNQEDSGFRSNPNKESRNAPQRFMQLLPTPYEKSNNAILNSPSNYASYNTYDQQRFIDSPLLPNPYGKPNDAIFNSPSNHASYNNYDQQRFIDSARHSPLLPNPYGKPNGAIFNSTSNLAPYNTYDQQRFIEGPSYMSRQPRPYGKPNQAVFTLPEIQTSPQMYNLSPVINIQLSQRSAASDSRRVFYRARAPRTYR